jgi:hypothetical protein
MTLLRLLWRYGLEPLFLQDLKIAEPVARHVSQEHVALLV